MRAISHYLLAILILSVYGIHVCPFLDSLTPLQLAGPLLVMLLVQMAIRRPLTRYLVDAVDLKVQTKRVLQLELALFATSGGLLMIFNTLYYGFPLESGLKVLVGFLALGFFTSIDLALEREYQLIQYLEESGEHLLLDERYFPLSGKFSLFASVSLLLVMIVVFLIINKDLEWLAEVGSSVSPGAARGAILAELLFVVAVILAQVVNVILSYARNLNRFLGNENSVLSDAAYGRLDVAVPVGTNDEFGHMARYTNRMVENLRASTEEIKLTQDATILALASLAETRDNETGAHILRTQRYVKALAENLLGHPAFQQELDDETIELLFKSAPLHDVGKVGIPDAILLKPGKLDDEEFRIMKTHAEQGAEALAVAQDRLGGTSFLRYAQEIALSHHEKWDGSGYPKGLAGEDIPISGRLMAVADVYDALISKRIYKPAFPHEKAMEIIIEGRGKHFDPDIVDAMLSIEDKFKEISARYGDDIYNQ